MNREPFNLALEAWLVRAIAVLLTYLAWAWGGTPTRFHFPLPWFGLLLFGLIFLLPAVYRGAGTIGQSLAASARRLLRDPVLYIGGLFILLLLVQWWNSQRYQFFNPIHKAWEYTPPQVPWMPSAFTRQAAGEMLVWFFPAWAMILAMRNPGISPRGMRSLWTWMIGNSAVLAVLGLLQKATGAPCVFWTPEIPGAIFFSSFAMANHASAFFALMFCLSAGLCIRELYSRTPFQWDVSVAFLLSATALNLVGATFSLSRIGIVLTWAAVMCLIGYTVARGWRRMSPVYRLNLTVALIGAVCFVFFVVAALPGHSVLNEIATLGAYNTVDLIRENIRTRLVLAAVDMLQEAPVFGLGGWGFVYLLPKHLTGWEGPITPGLANVHCDPLQFMVEFGAIGTVLIILTVAILAWPLIRARIWRHPLAFCTVLGLGLTVVHSLIDLPFRCPAILYTWLALLTGAGVMARTYQELETLAEG